MFRLEKEFRFEASHVLHHHDGKCARLHGHSWIGSLVVEGDQLEMYGPKQGMLLDFYDISRACKAIEDALDHRHLNDIVHAESPTSEIIARWVYRQTKERLPMLTEVVIQETCTSCCTYRE
jgi:6-pyruvoyltetrahydropterin/6-carboxytetrahydropterin synthase